MKVSEGYSPTLCGIKVRFDDNVTEIVMPERLFDVLYRQERERWAREASEANQLLLHLLNTTLADSPAITPQSRAILTNAISGESAQRGVK